MKAEELRIKPSDLRLGNWVMYDNRYFQISMIADVFPELNTNEFGIGVVDYNNIQPIPLTEEILLKCGFDDVTSYKDFWLTIEDDLRIEIALRHGDRVYTSISDMGISSDIKHLHQLQNLYFALTQTELEVSL